MEQIKKFSELSKNDVSIAGGKAASLGEMINSGIPVPDGFVITASAFEAYLTENDFHTEIDGALDNVNHEDVNSVEQASEKIQALIKNGKMTEELQNLITNSFSDLDSTFVAVRSSATAEDSLGAAWAGQLNTYLNTTEKTLIDNVKKCWASLFTPRAIVYRFEKGLKKTHVSVAVVVQKMVESVKSGIAFSVHPVTQDRNQIIIEAGFGLGEAVVSGQITPDSYIVDKELNIVEVHNSEQDRGMFKKVDGGVEWREIEGTDQVLSEEEIIEISEMVIKIEKHYGFPVDIEWAYEDQLYIVQSRPITTLTN